MTGLVSKVVAWLLDQFTHEKRPRTKAGGRPIPGYSLTNKVRKISDEQIKEWLWKHLRVMAMRMAIES